MIDDEVNLLLQQEVLMTLVLLKVFVMCGSLNTVQVYVNVYV